MRLKRRSQQKWVQPEQNSSNTSNDKPTDYDCPVCGHKLVEHQYIKDGQTKKMLRCPGANETPSDRTGFNESKKKHKDVAYFWNKNGTWWSKKFGELN